MASQLTFDSLDEVQRWALREVLVAGREAAPRGVPTRELRAISFALRHPRRRCITNSSRRWSLPLAIGEFCWHVSGSNELPFIEYYAPRWREFSTDRRTIDGSCYGKKMFGDTPDGFSPWSQLVELLRLDPDTRRAVLSFYDVSMALRADARDVACALTLQFLARDGSLDAIAYMRSNDAIWGLPYDVFLFTMLQELLACELGLALGLYFHVTGSLHLYGRHFKLAERILEDKSEFYFEMPPMQAHLEVPLFLRLESALRVFGGVAEEELQAVQPYWRDLLGVLHWYRWSKAEGGPAIEAILGDSPYGALIAGLSEAASRR